MATISFDTHQAIKLLRKKGFSQQQAEALIEFEKNKDTSQLTTKNDISNLKVWILSGFLVQTITLSGLLFGLLQFFIK